MAEYIDVYISLGKERIPVTPNPCVLKLEHDGIRFRNLSASDARVNLSEVPGFKTVSDLVVPANRTVVVASNPAEPRTAGESPYGVGPASVKGALRTDAGPRVILDI